MNNEAKERENKAKKEAKKEQEEDIHHYYGRPRPYGGKPREFFVGDHVRHFDPDHGQCMSRGTIIPSDTSQQTEKVLTKSMDGNEFLVDEKDIYTDLHLTTLKYDLYDRVL